MAKNQPPSADPEKQSEKEDTPFAEVLEDTPQEMIEMIKVMGSFRSSPSNPIAEKLTSEHIDKVLDHSDKRNERDRLERQQNRIFNLIVLVLGIGVIVFLIIFLKDNNQDLLIPIITAILSFIGGFAGGYGFKSYKDNKE